MIGILINMQMQNRQIIKILLYCIFNEWLQYKIIQIVIFIPIAFGTIIAYKADYT